MLAYTSAWVPTWLARETVRRPRSLCSVRASSSLTFLKHKKVLKYIWVMLLKCLTSQLIVNAFVNKQVWTIFTAWENVKCLFPLLCLCFHVSHKTCWSTKAFDTLTQYHKSLWELLFGICDSMLSHFCVPYVLFLSSCLSERPTFLRRPINQVVLEEEAVEFRCQVQGDPQPTVRWKKDEIDIPRGRWDGDTLAETSANLKHYFKRLLVQP